MGGEHHEVSRNIAATATLNSIRSSVAVVGQLREAPGERPAHPVREAGAARGDRNEWRSAAAMTIRRLSPTIAESASEPVTTAR